MSRFIVPIFAELLRVRPQIWPNLRIVEMGDRLLGRSGNLISAAAGVYRTQIAKEPELEEEFRAGGRGREVAYSDGPAISKLERKVAELLGKEAGLWFPKGIIAQQAALLVHASTTGCDVVALHPKSHLAVDETDAIQRLAGLTALRLGTDHRHFGIEDCESAPKWDPRKIRSNYLKLRTNL